MANRSLRSRSFDFLRRFSSYAESSRSGLKRDWANFSKPAVSARPGYLLGACVRLKISRLTDRSFRVCQLFKNFSITEPTNKFKPTTKISSRTPSATSTLTPRERGPPGGLAPCLSSAVGGLIERYTELYPDIEIICYRSGYKGLLLGDSIRVTEAIRASAALHAHGGSPIGNSRVKLTNVKDCVKRGLVKEGEDPLKVAADQLAKDQVDVLHTIGGDDTNTTAADLAAFLAENDYDLTVVGLPKTIDNDVFPIAQSLGAWTAAEEGARFFETSSPSTTPTRACSSSTKSWGATAAGSPPRLPMPTTNGSTASNGPRRSA